MKWRQQKSWEILDLQDFDYGRTAIFNRQVGQTTKVSQAIKLINRETENHSAMHFHIEWKLKMPMNSMQNQYYPSNDCRSPLSKSILIATQTFSSD